jgi:PPIC-type PPIASE domain
VRRLFSLVALALAAVTAAACDLSPPAATVAGGNVSRSQLDDQLSEISQSPYAQCALVLQGVNLPTQLTGAGEATVPSSLASYVLSTMVLERLVEAELARQRHPVTSADLGAARNDLAMELTAGSSSPSPCPGQIDGQALVSHLPAGFRDDQIAFLAAQERLAATLGHVDLSDAALRAYYDAHQSQFQELCLSDIAVQSQAQAQSIHDAIASGSSSFATEAQQNSIDTQTAADGGQIPCVPSSQIVNGVILAAVAGLSPGQLSAPVFEPGSGPGGSGVWFVLQLNGRPDIPFSQAAPQIRQQLLSAQNSKVSAAFARLAQQSKVTVDPRYGSWSPKAGIRPPTPPPAADLLSRTADQPAASATSSAASG